MTPVLIIFFILLFDLLLFLMKTIMIGLFALCFFAGATDLIEQDVAVVIEDTDG